MKKTHRLLAMMMAIIMVCTLLPIRPLRAHAEEIEHRFAAPDLTAAADKEAAPEGPLTADGFFTVVGSVTKRTNSDGSVKSVELGKDGTGAISFTVSGNAVVAVEFGSTGGSNTSTVGIWDAEGNLVSNLEGITEVTGTTATKLTYSLSAGTYRVVSPDASTHSRGARVYTIVVTEAGEAEAVETVYNFAAPDLTAAADKEAAPEGPLTADGYFAVIGSVTKRTNSDGSVKSVELGKDGTGAISFTVSGNAVVAVEFGSTGGSNTSTVGIWDAEGNLVSNLEGITEVTGTTATKLTYSLSAGTYRVVSPDASTHSRGARVYTISVIEKSGSAPAVSWANVPAPVITNVEQKDGVVEVTVQMSISAEGASSVTAVMVDANGKVLKDAMNTTQGDSQTFTFSPVASGTYGFKAVAKRIDEEAEKTSEEKQLSFVLPLAQPYIALVHKQAGGGLTPVWTESPEAESYEIYCNDQLVGTTNDRQYTISDLTAGEEYAIAVVAVRGEDKSAASAAALVTASETAETAWNFTRYGESSDDAHNGYTKNDDGTVTVWSEGGKGKIQSGGCDGLAFYYTAIPTEKNFTLKANIHVDSWTYSNGQDGFGMMVTDRLAPHGTGSGYWNNQLMALATKIEYRWDPDAEVVRPWKNTQYGKYSMRLGLGTIFKQGITPDSLAYLTGLPEGFDIDNVLPLDVTAAKQLQQAGGNYNIVGNATAAVEGTIAEVTDFILEIQKNNTGYFATYYDAEGNIIGQQKNYDPNALSHLDSDYVYAGFFASRNARITVDVQQFTITNPEDDAPAEEKPAIEIIPESFIASSSVSQTKDYELRFQANVAGSVQIRVNDVNFGTIVTVEPNKEYGGIIIPLTADEETKISVSFTPDPNQKLGEDEVLAGIGSVYKEINVSYTERFADQRNIYVAANAYSTGMGTKEKPLDIYTAVSVVRPGQTIVLMEGTYKLEKQLKIQRDMDGTAEKPIRMVADPNAKTRPVLDFLKLAEGFTTGGDYWYFYGFDVTNSLDGQKGFQISGDNNVVDNVHTYNNGNTGIQISRYAGTDETIETWPKNNLILNCTSYNNADSGYEDADGFAAKLTIGEGNVFDGCVAYNNADDGWDLYAKVATGSIGAVTIRNCVAYNNGYLMDGTNAGNGNGFKMGGESLSGKHRIINSVAFGNKAKGIDSNSCPDIIVENCTSYNNGSANVALYTNVLGDTNFKVSGVISYKDEAAANLTDENLKPQGNQSEPAYKNDSTYYWTGTLSQNAAGATFTGDMFRSVEFKGIARNEDNTIDMQDFLVLTESAPADAGARMSGQASAVITLEEETGCAAGNHGTEEIIPGKAPTCTADGYSDGKKCSLCGLVIEERKPQPATGHKEETVPGKAPTETETGLTEGKKCSVCGKVLLEQEVIPATGKAPTEPTVPTPAPAKPGSSAWVVMIVVAVAVIAAAVVVLKKKK